MAMLRRLALSVPVGGLVVIVLNGVVAAGFDPYTSGTNGYDISYVQCGSAAPAGAFGVIGINAGYPFTYYNSCLGAELAGAQQTGNPAVYINTGYDPTYTAVDGRHTTQDCATSSQAISGTQSQQAAWAVGCSEAERDAGYLTSQSTTPPTAWWLDVETTNSWSTTDLTLNSFTIQGIVQTLRQSAAVPVGIYSTSSQWLAITGGYRAPADADWLATAQRTQKRAKQYCGSSGFSGSPIWLVQYRSTTDRDYVC
jgi:hypothetical protein